MRLILFTLLHFFQTVMTAKSRLNDSSALLMSKLCLIFPYLNLFSYKMLMVVFYSILCASSYLLCCIFFKTVMTAKSRLNDSSKLLMSNLRLNFPYLHLFSYKMLLVVFYSILCASTYLLC